MIFLSFFCPLIAILSPSLMPSVPSLVDCIFASSSCMIFFFLSCVFVVVVVFLYNTLYFFTLISWFFHPFFFSAAGCQVFLLLIWSFILTADVWITFWCFPSYSSSSDFFSFAQFTKFSLFSFSFFLFFFLCFLAAFFILVCSPAQSPALGMEPAEPADEDAQHVWLLLESMEYWVALIWLQAESTDLCFTEFSFVIVSPSFLIR